MDEIMRKSYLLTHLLISLSAFLFSLNLNASFTACSTESLADRHSCDCILSTLATATGTSPSLLPTIS